MQFLKNLIACSTVVVTAFSAATSTNVHAQDVWPNKPITLVVPFTAGGPTDVVGRALASSITKHTGKPVVIENKAGAGGTVGAGYVKNAKPDGYTFLLHHNGMATAPALYRKLNFNPLTDFEYVSQVVDVPMTLVARKDFPAKDIRELIAYVKANSSKVNLGNAGVGSVSHLCGMMFQKALGTDLTTVPFSGAGPAMNALLGGQIDVMCDQTTNTMNQIKAGTVKVYAVSTNKQIKALPSTPTLAESGLKDFEVVVWHGVYAPKGTPKNITAKFGEMITAALKDPEVMKTFADLAAEPVSSKRMSSAGLDAWLKSEINKYGPVIREAAQFAD